METVFIDSSAYVGFYSVHDAHHEVAQKKLSFLAEQDTPLVTSYGVIDETATVVSQCAGKDVSVHFLNSMISGRGPEILELDQHIRDSAYSIFRLASDKNISTIDCQIAAICREHGIKTIFTFDKHFTKLGLKIL